MPSIGHKLTLSFVFISLVTVVIMEGLFFMAIHQYYVSGMSQTMVNHAEASAAMFDRYAPAGSIDEKVTFIYENMRVDEPALVEVYDTDNRFIINNIGNQTNHTQMTNDCEEALKGETSIWRGRINTREPILSVSVPLKDRDKVVGILRFVSSMTLVNAMLRSNMLMAFIIGGAILSVAALLGYMMSTRILVPVKDLIRVTREISSGNLQVEAKQYYHDEIGQLASVVNHMTEQIRLSDQAKSDFISSISHELRTPLTSIKGWIETIDDNPEDIETAKIGIGIIERETNRLIHLVNDLLDFSRLQSQRIELKLEAMWIDEFLEAIYNQFIVQANQEGVNLRLHLDGQNALIIADENRLRQVFINVIDNSFKFLKGHPHPELVIQSHMLDDQVVISIEDNGPGMRSDELILVKKKFYKGSTKRSGTGLGLSIANEIIELHNGTLFIDSIRGVGTRVSVVLPFTEAN